MSLTPGRSPPDSWLPGVRPAQVVTPRPGAYAATGWLCLDGGLVFAGAGGHAGSSRQRGGLAVAGHCLADFPQLLDLLVREQVKKRPANLLDVARGGGGEGGVA